MNRITSATVQQRSWIIAALIGAAAVLATVGIVTAGIATAKGADDSRLTGTELAHASDAALTEVGPATVTDARHRTEPGPSYTVETRLANGVEVAVELDRLFVVVWASAPGWIGGAAPGLPARVLDAAEHASVERTSAEQIALAEVGGGTVTRFSRTDAIDHALEVEVTQTDGTKNVVNLTERGEVARLTGLAG
jgi:hypothetical protein